MVDEEADLALDSLQARRRQLRLAQGSASDRERVDRVRLAADARAAARAGHELGRDAHDLLARSQQEALERDGDVPAVLERPHSLVGKAARPAQELLVTGTPCLHRALGEQLADSVIDGRGGVRCLVWVYSDYDHSWSPFTEVAIDKGVPADRPQWGRKATLLSGHAGAPRTAAGDRSHAGQASRADSEPRGQPAAGSEPNRHDCHEPVRENQDDTEASLTLPRSAGSPPMRRRRRGASLRWPPVRTSASRRPAPSA